MKSLFEQSGGTYSACGDYRLPNLALLKQTQAVLGRFGRVRLNYLKNHRRVLYTNLLTSGKLSEHLAEIDTQAHDRLELVMKQMAAAQGVTEALKSTDPMAWVGAMNNIKSCAEEIVLVEIIYA